MSSIINNKILISKRFIFANTVDLVISACLNLPISDFWNISRKLELVNFHFSLVASFLNFPICPSREIREN